MAFVAPACGRPDVLVWLDFPSADGAASVVFALPAARGFELHAASTDAVPESLVLQASGDQDEVPAIQALFFQQGLAAYGVTAGRMRAPNGVEPTRPLYDVGAPSIFDAPRRIFVTRTDPTAGDGTWEELTQLDPELAKLRLPLPAKDCVTFAAPLSLNELEAQIRFAVKIDAETALLRDNVGRFHVATARGTTQVSLPGPADFTALRNGPNGDIWLGDLNGQLWRAAPSAATGIETPTRVGADSGLGAPIRSLDVAATADGFEVFVITTAGQVARFDGNVWTQFGTVQTWGSDIVRTAPGEAMILTGEGGVIHMVRGGRITQEEAVSAAMLSLQAVEGFGVVGGTIDGEFFTRGERGWSRIGQTSYGWWAVGLTPYEDGFAFLLSSGSIGVYRPEVGYCGDLGLSRIISDGKIISLGRDLLVIGKVPDVERSFTLVLPRSGR